MILNISSPEAWSPEFPVARQSHDSASQRLGFPKMQSSGLFSFLLLSMTLLAGALVSASDSHNSTPKRSFTDLGCMGVYDRAKFARLDRVCEECYQIFRESEVHTLCRSNCFKNTLFVKCIDVLLLQKDQQRLSNMVEQLYG